MKTRIITWLIFPIALTLMSLWLIIAGAHDYRLKVGIILSLCLLAFVRQAFLLQAKGEKIHALLAFATVVICIVVVIVSVCRLH
jgi:heme/copper-type cytochrome/quinol oxidase subunit 4